MFDSSMFSSAGLSELSGTGLAVIAILFVLSIWSLGVSIERLVALARARRQSLAFAKLLTSRRDPQWIEESLKTARRFPHSHLARVVSAGLQAYQQKRTKKTLSSADVMQAVERALDRSSIRTGQDLRRGIGGLANIATTAPFIGLFGTVVGIIHAFQDIAKFGTGGFETVSRGIAEALWTTALGLVVAIPAAWMFNHLSQRIERLNLEMASSSAELLDFFLDLEDDAPEGLRAVGR